MTFTPHPQDRSRATLVLDTGSLGEGGQGVVTRVLGPEDLVYKEYMPQVGKVNASALAELVDFGRLSQAAGNTSVLPREAGRSVQSTLLAQCAWPVARIVEGRQVTGFLMPRVPNEFYAPIGGTDKLVELQYLLYRPNWAWTDLHQPDIRGRLEIAVLAAKLIVQLHGDGWVIGDLSFRNLLWSPGRPYKVFMLDCDGLRRTGAEPVLRQAHTPDWDDPHQPSTGPELDTDRYKLALLVGRVLSQTASVRPGQDLELLPGLPERVDTAVKDLFVRAQGPRGTRPTAVEWVRALDGRERITVSRPPRPAGPTVPAGPPAPLSLPGRGAGRARVTVSRPAPRTPVAPPQPAPPPTPPPPPAPPTRLWTPIPSTGARSSPQ